MTSYGALTVYTKAEAIILRTLPIETMTRAQINAALKNGAGK